MSAFSYPHAAQGAGQAGRRAAVVAGLPMSEQAAAQQGAGQNFMQQTAMARYAQAIQQQQMQAEALGNLLKLFTAFSKFNKQSGANPPSQQGRDFNAIYGEQDGLRTPQSQLNGTFYHQPPQQPFTQGGSMGWLNDLLGGRSQWAP